jgi:hypothetical protein
MDVMPAHIHAVANGLGVVGQIPYQYVVTSTVTNLFTTMRDISLQQKTSGWLISVALITGIVVMAVILAFEGTDTRSPIRK